MYPCLHDQLPHFMGKSLDNPTLCTSLTDPHCWECSLLIALNCQPVKIISQQYCELQSFHVCRLSRLVTKGHFSWYSSWTLETFLFHWRWFSRCAISREIVCFPSHETYNCKWCPDSDAGAWIWKNGFWCYLHIVKNWSGNFSLNSTRVRALRWPLLGIFSRIFFIFLRGIPGTNHL